MSESEHTSTRPGRPKIDPRKRLERPVYVLFTEEEREELDKLARDPQWKSRSKIVRTAFRYWLKRQRQKPAA